MRIPRTIAALVGVGCLAVSATSAALPGGPPVFEPDARWVTLESAGDGHWLATREHWSDVWTYTSSDDGETWTRRDITHGPRGKFANDGENYGVILFGDRGPNSAWRFMRSSDRGVSWSSEGWMGIQPQVDYGSTGFADIAARNGAWVVFFHAQPLCEPIGGCAPTEEAPSFGIHYMRSTDFGTSWSDLIELHGSGEYPSLVAGGNGTWIGAWSDEGIWVTRSTDDGVTWSTPALVSNAGEKPVVATDHAGSWFIADGSGGYTSSVDDGVSWASRQEFPVLVGERAENLFKPTPLVSATHSADGWMLTSEYSGGTFYSFESSDPTASPHQWQTAFHVSFASNIGGLPLVSGGDGTTLLTSMTKLLREPPFPAECADGVDNDGDGATDTADSDCDSASGFSESPECSDALDNDGDFGVDAGGYYPDPDCESSSDTTETCEECAVPHAGPVAPAGYANHFRYASGYPWNCDDPGDPKRYQQWYDGSHVGTGFIRGIRFRRPKGVFPHTEVTIPDVTIRLSPTSLTVSEEDLAQAWSSVLEENLGAEVTVIHEGALDLVALEQTRSPVPKSNVIIDFQKPYWFDAESGANLIMDVTIPACVESFSLDSVNSGLENAAAEVGVYTLYADDLETARFGTPGYARGIMTQFVRPACSDGLDNDGDGNVDHPADEDCVQPSDPFESFVPQCSDGFDNNGNGGLDYPGEPGCTDPEDRTEEFDCRDGLDNDGDGSTDLADIGCAVAIGDKEDPECSNGLDDDMDGFTDLADDACQDEPSGDIEGPECHDGVDNDGDGKIDFGNSVDNDNNCYAPTDPIEKCGLGFELALIVPVLMGLRSRARRRLAQRLSLSGESR